MNPAAFLDANIPIYAVGRDRPPKKSCSRIPRMVADDPRPFVTDSEVLRKLMHRYLSLGRWVLGWEVLRSFAEAMQGRIEPIYAEDVILASELADHQPHVSARDLVHATVMQRLGLTVSSRRTPASTVWKA